MDQERVELQAVEESRARVAQDLRDAADSVNVVQRAKDAVSDRVGVVKGAVSDGAQSAKYAALAGADIARDAVQAGAQRLQPVARNPAIALAAGILGGFFLGLAVPRSRRP